MSLARLKAGKALLACALAIGLMPTTALAGELDDDISAQARTDLPNNSPAAESQTDTEGISPTPKAWWGDEHQIDLVNGESQTYRLPTNDILAGHFTLSEPSIVFFTTAYDGTASTVSINGRSPDDSTTFLLDKITQPNTTRSIGPIVLPAGSYKLTAFAAYSNAGNVTMAYSATPAGCDNVEIEYNNQSQCATSIKLDTDYRASTYDEHDGIEGAEFRDLDYYAFSLDGETPITIDVSGAAAIGVSVQDANGNVYRRNADTSGSELSFATQQNGSSFTGEFDCGTLPAGTYYIRTSPTSLEGRAKLYDIMVSTKAQSTPDRVITQDTINKANQDLTEAQNNLASAVTIQKQAQQAYNEAKSQLDQISANVRYDSNAIARGSLGFFEWAGSSNAANIIANPEATSNLPDTNTHLGARYDATSLDNMQLAINRMSYVNYYRMQESLPALYLYDTLVAQGQIQCNFAAQSIWWSGNPHAGNNGCVFPIGENLSYGYQNPFDGWYTEEKQEYDSAIAAGKTPDPNSTGHYQNIVNKGYKYFGCGVNSNVNLYGWCDEQCFDSGGQFNNLNPKEDCYSYGAYYSRFMLYYNTVHGIVDPSYQAQVDRAESNLQIANANVAKAQMNVTRAQNEVDRANSNLVPVRRICGDEAAETSVAISKKMFPEGSRNLIIARDDDFKDAMSATGMAGSLNCPILLVNREYGMTIGVANEIMRLKASNVYIIGGPGAIPGLNTLKQQLSALNIDNPTNLYGNEACDTSVICADMLMSWNADNGRNADYAVVAMSDNFQDALSMSSFAYNHRVPILLLSSADNAADRRLPDDGVAMLKTGKLASAKILVAGGTGAVPDAIFSDHALSIYKRLAGWDGYDTSNQIANWMIDNELLSAKSVTFACGAEPACGLDALAGCAVGGQECGPILLASTQPDYGQAREATISGRDSEGSLAFLQKHSKDIQWVNVLGGTYVMPEQLINDIESVLD